MGKVAKISPVLLPQNVLKTATAAPDTEAVKKPTQTVSKTVSNKVSPVLLPQNVLKTAAEIDDVALVARTEIAASKTTSKQKLKKNYNSFHGEGVISFLFHTKMWGRIRLATRTKWGESQVFFHRNHLGDSQAAPLFHGQSVK